MRTEKPLKPIFHQHYYVNLICKNFPGEMGRYRPNSPSKSTHNNKNQLVKHKRKQKKNLHVNKVKNKLSNFFNGQFLKHLRSVYQKKVHFPVQSLWPAN